MELQFIVNWCFVNSKASSLIRVYLNHLFYVSRYCRSEYKSYNILVFALNQNRFLLSSICLYYDTTCSFRSISNFFLLNVTMTREKDVTLYYDIRAMRAIL